MDILQAIVLGVVQGFTEFLPISSSGHLILIPKIFNWSDQGLAFDAIIHLATALAIIFILWKDIIKILKGLNLKNNSSERRENTKIIGLLALGIIPAGLIGFFFENYIENVLRSVTIVGVSLIVWGIVLFFAEAYTRKTKDKIGKMEKMNWKQSLVVGLAQVLAFIPGTSRSGITLTFGLFVKMNRALAVKFSFLMGLPLILAAGFLKLLDVFSVGVSANDIWILIFGFLGALISGLTAIKLLIWLAEKADFKIFVWYRIILGVLILFLF